MDLSRAHLDTHFHFEILELVHDTSQPALIDFQPLCLEAGIELGADRLDRRVRQA